MIRPERLKPGDLIGVVAPSSPVPPEELEKGIALLEARGYRVRVGRHVLATTPVCDYLAGSDAQRAEDLNAVFADPEVDAVFCARGGYGAMRLFSLLDWEAIARRPRLFVGYSDITSLHLALMQFGWATVHATMVSSLWRLDETALARFWALVEGEMGVENLPADPAAIETIVPGSVEGELAGGNLCLMAQACGSRFSPRFEGKIVMIEDIGDPVYRADRDLVQLLNAGAFDGAAGFVIGDLTGYEKYEADPPRNTPMALWTDFFSALGKPTIAKYPFGHIPNPLPIPLGVRARLDADAKRLSLLERPVR